MSFISENKFYYLPFGLVLLFICSSVLDQMVPILENFLIILMCIVVIIEVSTIDSEIILKKSQFVILAIYTLTLVVSLLRALTAATTWFNIRFSIVMVPFVVVGYLSATKLSNPKRLHIILLLLSLLTSLIGYLSLLNLYIELPISAPIGPARALGGFKFPTRRTLGIQMAYANYGMLAGLTLPYVILLGVRPSLFEMKKLKTRYKYAIIWIITGTSIGLIILQSRSTLISITFLIIAAIFISGLHPNPLWRIKNRVVPISVILFGGTLLIINLPELIDILLSPNEGASLPRVRQYKTALRVIQEAPLLGKGWGFPLYSMNIRMSIHNFWLRLGASAGIPIMVAWGLVHVLLFRELVRGTTCLRRQISAFNLVGLFGFLSLTIELMLFPGLNAVHIAVMSILLSIIGLEPD